MMVQNQRRVTNENAELLSDRLQTIVVSSKNSLHRLFLVLAIELALAVACGFLIPTSAMRDIWMLSTAMFIGVCVIVHRFAITLRKLRMEAETVAGEMQNRDQDDVRNIPVIMDVLTSPTALSGGVKNEYRAILARLLGLVTVEDSQLFNPRMFNLLMTLITNDDSLSAEIMRVAALFGGPKAEAALSRLISRPETFGNDPSLLLNLQNCLKEVEERRLSHAIATALLRSGNRPINDLPRICNNMGDTADPNLLLRATSDQPVVRSMDNDVTPDSRQDRINGHVSNKREHHVDDH